MYLPIYEELVSILQYDIILLGTAIKIAVYGIEICLEWYGCGTLIIYGGKAFAECCDKGIGNLLAREVHTYRVALYDRYGAVDVDDQARQRVALAVN